MFIKHDLYQSNQYHILSRIYKLIQDSIIFIHRLQNNTKSSPGCNHFHFFLLINNVTLNYYNNDNNNIIINKMAETIHPKQQTLFNDRTYMQAYINTLKDLSPGSIIDHYQQVINSVNQYISILVCAIIINPQDCLSLNIQRISYITSISKMYAQYVLSPKIQNLRKLLVQMTSPKYVLHFSKVVNNYNYETATKQLLHILGTYIQPTLNHIQKDIDFQAFNVLKITPSLANTFYRKSIRKMKSIIQSKIFQIISLTQRKNDKETVISCVGTILQQQCKIVTIITTKFQQINKIFTPDDRQKFDQKIRLYPLKSVYTTLMGVFTTFTRIQLQLTYKLAGHQSVISDQLQQVQYHMKLPYIKPLKIVNQESRIQQQQQKQSLKKKLCIAADKQPLPVPNELIIQLNKKQFEEQSIINQAAANRQSASILLQKPPAVHPVVVSPIKFFYQQGHKSAPNFRFYSPPNEKFAKIQNWITILSQSPNFFFFKNCIFTSNIHNGDIINNINKYYNYHLPKQLIKQFQQMSATVNEIKQLIGDQGQSNILKNIIMSTNDLKEAAHKGLNMFRQLNNKYQKTYNEIKTFKPMLQKSTSQITNTLNEYKTQIHRSLTSNFSVLPDKRQLQASVALINQSLANSFGKTNQYMKILIEPMNINIEQMRQTLKLNAEQLKQLIDMTNLKFNYSFQDHFKQLNNELIKQIKVQYSKQGKVIIDSINQFKQQIITQINAQTTLMNKITAILTVMQNQGQKDYLNNTNIHTKLNGVATIKAVQNLAQNIQQLADKVIASNPNQLINEVYNYVKKQSETLLATNDGISSIKLKLNEHDNRILTNLAAISDKIQIKVNNLLQGDKRIQDSVINNLQSLKSMIQRLNSNPAEQTILIRHLIELFEANLSSNPESHKNLVKLYEQIHKSASANNQITKILQQKIGEMRSLYANVANVLSTVRQQLKQNHSQTLQRLNRNQGVVKQIYKQMSSGRSQLQSIIKVSSEVIDKTMNNNKNILVQQAERNRSQNQALHRQTQGLIKQSTSTMINQMQQTKNTLIQQNQTEHNQTRNSINFSTQQILNQQALNSQQTDNVIRQSMLRNEMNTMKIQSQVNQVGNAVMTNLLVNKYENSLLGNTLLNNTQQLGAVINHTAQKMMIVNQFQNREMKKQMQQYHKQLKQNNVLVRNSQLRTQRAEQQIRYIKQTSAKAIQKLETQLFQSKKLMQKQSIQKSVFKQKFENQQIQKQNLKAKLQQQMLRKVESPQLVSNQIENYTLKSRLQILQKGSKQLQQLTKSLTLQGSLQKVNNIMLVNQQLQNSQKQLQKSFKQKENKLTDEVNSCKMSIQQKENVINKKNSQIKENKQNLKRLLNQYQQITSEMLGYKRQTVSKFNVQELQQDIIAKITAQKLTLQKLKKTVLKNQKSKGELSTSLEHNIQFHKLKQQQYLKKMKQLQQLIKQKEGQIKQTDSLLSSSNRQIASLNATLVGQVRARKQAQEVATQIGQLLQKKINENEQLISKLKLQKIAIQEQMAKNKSLNSSKYDELSQQKQLIQRQLSTLKSQISQLNTKFTSAKQQIQTKDAEIKNLNIKINNIDVENKRISGQLTQSNRKKDQLEFRSQQTQRQINRLKKEVHDLQLQTQKANSTINADKTKISELQKRTQALNTQITLKQENVKRLNRMQAQFDQQKKSLQRKYEKSIQEQIQAKQNQWIIQRKNKTRQIQSLRLQITNKQKQLNSAIQSKTRELSQKDIQAMQVKRKNQIQIQRLKTQMKYKQQHITRLKQNYQGHITQLKDSVAAKQKQIQKIQKFNTQQINRLKTQINDKQQQLSSLKHSDSLNAQKLKQQIRSKQNQLESIKQNSSNQIKKLRRQIQSKQLKIQQGLQLVNKNIKQIQQLNQNISSLKDKQTQHLAETKNKIHELQKLQKARNNLEKKINQLKDNQAQNNRLKQQLQTLNDQINQYKTQLVRHQELTVSLSQEINKLKSNCTSLEVKLTRAKKQTQQKSQKDRKTWQQQKSKLTKLIKQYQQDAKIQKLQIQQSEQTIERKRVEYLQLQKENQTLVAQYQEKIKNTNIANTQRKFQLQRQIQKGKVQLKNKVKQLHELQQQRNKKVQTLQKSVQQKNKLIQSQTKKLQQIKQSATELQKVNEELNKSKQELIKQINIQKARIRQLQQQQKKNLNYIQQLNQSKQSMVKQLQSLQNSQQQRIKAQQTINLLKSKIASIQGDLMLLQTQVNNNVQIQSQVKKLKKILQNYKKKMSKLQKPSSQLFNTLTHFMQQQNELEQQIKLYIQHFQTAVQQEQDQVIFDNLMVQLTALRQRIPYLWKKVVLTQKMENLNKTSVSSNIDDSREQAFKKHSNQSFQSNASRNNFKKNNISRVNAQSILTDNIQDISVISYQRPVREIQDNPSTLQALQDSFSQAGQQFWVNTTNLQQNYQTRYAVIGTNQPNAFNQYYQLKSRHDQFRSKYQKTRKLLDFILKSLVELSQGVLYGINAMQAQKKVENDQDVKVVFDILIKYLIQVQAVVADFIKQIKIADNT